jgi:hypothetical protein
LIPFVSFPGNLSQKQEFTVFFDKIAVGIDGINLASGVFSQGEPNDGK